MLFRCLYHTQVISTQGRYWQWRIEFFLPHRAITRKPELLGPFSSTSGEDVHGSKPHISIQWNDKGKLYDELLGTLRQINSSTWATKLAEKTSDSQRTTQRDTAAWQCHTAHCFGDPAITNGHPIGNFRIRRTVRRSLYLTTTCFSECSMARGAFPNRSRRPQIGRTMDRFEKPVFFTLQDI